MCVLLQFGIKPSLFFSLDNPAIRLAYWSGQSGERERQRGHVRGGVPAAIAIVRVWLSSSGISLALVEREKGGGEEGGGWVCID